MSVLLPAGPINDAQLVLWKKSEIRYKSANEIKLIPAQIAVQDGVALIFEIPHSGLVINPYVIEIIAINKMKIKKVLDLPFFSEFKIK